MLSAHLFPSRRSPWPALLATVLIATGLAGAIYLSAAKAASWLASTLSAKETLRHARAVEFEAAARSVRYRTDQNP